MGQNLELGITPVSQCTVLLYIVTLVPEKGCLVRLGQGEVSPARFPCNV